jgi:hypothetical protein
MALIEELRLFLDQHVKRDSLIGCVARGEVMTKSKRNAGIKRVALYFCGNRHDQDMSRAIGSDYQRRRAAAAAQQTKEK